MLMPKMGKIAHGKCRLVAALIMPRKIMVPALDTMLQRKRAMR